MLMGGIKNENMTLVRKPEEKRTPGRLGVHRMGPNEPQRNRM
jgi:hypothetical protein